MGVVLTVIGSVIGVIGFLVAITGFVGLFVPKKLAFDSRWTALRSYVVGGFVCAVGLIILPGVSLPDFEEQPSTNGSAQSADPVQACTRRLENSITDDVRRIDTVLGYRWNGGFAGRWSDGRRYNGDWFGRDHNYSLVRFEGDKFEIQLSGLGWRQYSYWCYYDVNSDRVIETYVEEGPLGSAYHMH